MQASLSKAIGPGILFAGAAIGVSHLVQATSAGASFGLWLLPAVLLAHAAKYPSMVFGPRYATATGRSLVEGYKAQGPVQFALFALIALGTSFTILAAVTVVAASVLRTALGLQGIGLPIVCGGLLAGSAALLAAGGFRWLDLILKVMMVVLLVATLAAAVSVIPRMDFAVLTAMPVGLNLTALGLVVTLVGWMPAPLDITVWHSLWTLDKAEQTGQLPTGRQCKIDFNIGYSLCVVTACSFMLLGAVVLYQSGVKPQQAAGAFVDQLFGLYTEALGEWVRPLIGVAASAVMLSTLLTVFDAMPRTGEALTAAAQGKPRPTKRSGVYWIWVLVFTLGAMAIILNAQSALKPLVNLATTLSFVATPVLAWFNHQAMHSEDISPEHRPSRGMTVMSLVCVVFWAVFALVFLAHRMGVFTAIFPSL